MSEQNNFFQASGHDNHVMVVMFTYRYVELLLFFHQEKSEKVVLDVVDQVFPTVLEKVLHSTPQSEKVLTGNCWLPENFKFTPIKSILFSSFSYSQDLWVMWTF